MRLYIYVLDETLFEGEIEKVSLPTEDGEITILPGHIPLVATLKAGAVRGTSADETKEFRIEAGLVRADSESVVVLAD